MKLKDGFVLREIAGNFFVVPVGSRTVDFSAMISLNETGAFLWKQLETEQTADSLLQALLDEYDVTAEVAQADVDRFIASLQEAELLA